MTSVTSSGPVARRGETGEGGDLADSTTDLAHPHNGLALVPGAEIEEGEEEEMGTSPRDIADPTPTDASTRMKGRIKTTPLPPQTEGVVGGTSTSNLDEGRDRFENSVRGKIRLQMTTREIGMMTGKGGTDFLVKVVAQGD